MEQIFVESNKNYYHGFILKEQELRRIIDLILEQFKKISEKPIEFIYTLKFQNGAIANTSNIEDILKQENEGSSSIVRLQISAKQENLDGDATIKIDFRNTEVDDDLGENPIAHSIKGQSRDWVFVTSSLIEERITKIKRKSLDHMISKGPGKLLFRLMFPFLMLGVMMAIFAGMPNASNRVAEKQQKLLRQIEKSWKNKTITDPVDAIIQIEKGKADKDYRLDTGALISDVFLAKPIIILVSSLIIIMLLVYIISKLYPSYNFCWGNYLESFTKLEGLRKLIIGIILGTFALGVIVNLVSNYIWEKI